MAARLIHFGIDCYHRLDVLERAGYQVALAESVSELEAQFRHGLDWDAVVISETETMELSEAVHNIRAATQAPIMLFRCTTRWIDERSFSWVVETVERPETWLRELALMIVRYRITPQTAAWCASSAWSMRSPASAWRWKPTPASATGA